LVALTAVACGALLGVAYAGHWHDYSRYGWQWHGMKQGTNPSGGYYSAQVEKNSPHPDHRKLCAVGNNAISTTNAVRNDAIYGNGGICVVEKYGGHPESRGWARVYAEIYYQLGGYVDYSFDTHYHYAH
jgi:hypothetical protein